MFPGWPFYRPRGSWNDAGYGCYGPGSHSSSGPNFYGYPASDPFFSEASRFPFHRRCSPFTRRNHNPFENMCDADQPVHSKRTPRTHVKSPNSVAATPPVAMEKHVDTSKKPVDTMASTVASSTASASDNSKEAMDTTAATLEQAWDTRNPEMPTKAEEPKTSVPIEVKRIEEIMEKSVELEKKVTAYTGVLGSKDYIYIEESLVAILLQLDKVETNGNMEIRKARKLAVCKIQQMLTELESKAKDNVAATELSNEAETMGTDEATGIPPATSAGKDNSEDIATNDNAITNDGTMDIGKQEATNSCDVKQPSTTSTDDSNGDESRATVTLSTTGLGDAVVTDKEIEHSSVMEEFPLTISEGVAEEHEAAIDPSSSVDDSEAVAEDKVGQSPVTLDSKESAMLTNKDGTSVVKN